MLRKPKLRFPGRTSQSLEDAVKEDDLSAWAGMVLGESLTVASWHDVLQRRPLDRPFYTALNDRACILVYFSPLSLPSAQAISKVVASKLPLTLHFAAFVEGTHPILRSHLVFPDNPLDPLILESPLDIRDGNVQDFCQAAMLDEKVDVILTHEEYADDETYAACAYAAPGLGAILGTELEKVLSNLSPTTDQSDFLTSVRTMEARFPSASAGIDRARCVKLPFAGDARNKQIEYKQG